MAQSDGRVSIDGGVIDWVLGLAKAYGWLLTIALVGAVALIFTVQKTAQKATEKAVENAFAREAKRFELAAGRRSSFVQKVQTDRWEAVNDFVIRIERIITNLNRSRHGQTVPGLFDESAAGSRDIVPLTAVFEDLEGKRFLLGEDFYQRLNTRANIALNFASTANTEEALTAVANAKETNMRELERTLDGVFRLAAAYRDED